MLLAEPTWKQLSERPVSWHAERCVPDALTARLLALSNATSLSHPKKYPGVARIHSIPEQGDPAAVAVRRLVSRRTGLPLANFEPLFVLEYAAGHTCNLGQAMPHHDWNCPNKRGTAGASNLDGPSDPELDDPSDGVLGCPQLRLVTSLVYLNSVPAGWGGGTVLRRAGLRVGAMRGACFLWFNARRGERGIRVPHVGSVPHR